MGASIEEAREQMKYVRSSWLSGGLKNGVLIYTSVEGENLSVKPAEVKRNCVNEWPKVFASVSRELDTKWYNK